MAIRIRPNNWKTYISKIFINSALKNFFNCIMKSYVKHASEVIN